jgi:hypothetical protein
MVRLSKWYSNIAVILFNTVILLVILEVGAGVFLRVFPRETNDQKSLNSVLRLQYYFGQDWSREYWTEHLIHTKNWHYALHSLWQTDAYDGTYIHVDEHGRRLTTNGNNGVCQEGQYRIFLFGGSTMWGFGVRDKDTIPSFIQAQLPDVCVLNYGELGYTSTQALIRLQHELSVGNVPNMVIFYDGVNDTSTANRYSIPGGHFFYEVIEPVVKSKPNYNPLLMLIRDSNLYDLIAGEPPFPGPPNLATPPFDKAFLDDVTGIYLANVRNANLLADSYGFAFFAFIQPVLPVIERPLSDEEQTFLYQMAGGLPDLVRTVYPRWQAVADNDPDDYLHYLGTALDHVQELVWIDWHHLTPWGNLAMSDTILKIIRPTIGE